MGAEEEKQEAGAGDGEGSRFIQEERAHRLAKLDAMRERGIDPYPVRFDRDHTAAEIQERFAGLGPGADSGERVSVAGRVIALRRHGGLDFIDLRDETAKIQLIATRDELGEDALHDLNALDLGDWIGAEGIVVTSRRGELSIRVESFKLLSKALRPLPDMRHGLTDPEARYRRRYLDLIVDDDSREIFAKRSTVIAATREVLLERGFREVETPVLLEPGGRRRGAAVHHPPQRARHRHVPADRPRAAAEAADRRRHEPGLRGRPGLPQRGPRHPPQPRVHDARGLPGVRRLPRHDGPDRGDHRGVAASPPTATRRSTSTAASST